MTSWHAASQEPPETGSHGTGTHGILDPGGSSQIGYYVLPQRSACSSPDQVSQGMHTSNKHDFVSTSSGTGNELAQRTYERVWARRKEENVRRGAYNTWHKAQGA